MNTQKWNLMDRHDERGIALVLALFLMTALSVIGASLMFLSQTETYASMNYRMMSQARYAGEAGIQKAANFLLDTTQYHPPTTSGSDLISLYNRNVSPVTLVSNGQPVVLSANPAIASNYPVASVVTAFNTAAKGTLPAANASISYSAHATLLSMQQFESYGGGPAVLQMWQITGDGVLGGSRTATVEVVATIDTPKVPANSYAAFATYNGCDAIYFHGNVTVDSYDSSQGPPTGAGNSTESSGGDVGTNGNLHIDGSVAVDGNLYTPRQGVGACTLGNITGLSEGGSATVAGSEVQLPTAVTYPMPTFSSTPPTTAVTIDASLLGNAGTACSSLGLVSGTNCTVNAASKTVTVDGHAADVTLPSVNVASGYTLILTGHSTTDGGAPQTVNMNSLTGSGNVQINANLAGNVNDSVVLKIAGKNSDGTDMTVPFDLSTMTWKQNSPTTAYDASTLQIVYGGPATINMQGGNSQSAATVYAPNATFTLQGTQDFFGSILAKTITNGGNASIHYDRRLQKDFYVAGQPVVGTFTWNRN
jgi:Tfp pilus assembly protein PilX